MCRCPSRSRHHVRLRPVAKVSDFPIRARCWSRSTIGWSCCSTSAGQFYAIDDVCTHDGGPLGEGRAGRACTIACPRHGAKFDIRNGAALTMPATQADGGARSESRRRRTCCVKHYRTRLQGADQCPWPSPKKPFAKRSSKSSIPSCSSTSSTWAWSTLVDRRARPSDKANVKIEMTMTSPACPAGPQLIGQSKQVVGALRRRRRRRSEAGDDSALDARSHDRRRPRSIGHLLATCGAA